jgi:serine/threonine protein kinase
LQEKEIGFICVALLNIRPENNKQSFDVTGERYQHTIRALRNAYETHFEKMSASIAHSLPHPKVEDTIQHQNSDSIFWAQCSRCEKWRITGNADYADSEFICHISGRKCEDPEDEDRPGDYLVNVCVGGVMVDSHEVIELDKWKLQSQFESPKKNGKIEFVMNSYGKSSMYRFYSEIEEMYFDFKFLITLSHPFLVPFLGFCPASYAIVSCAEIGIPLSVLIEEKRKKCPSFNFANIIEILFCAWTALAYLHQRSIAHNLVRPECIYIQNETRGFCTAKLGDLYSCDRFSSLSAVRKEHCIVHSNNLWRYSSLNLLRLGRLVIKFFSFSFPFFFFFLFFSSSSKYFISQQPTWEIECENDRLGLMCVTYEALTGRRVWPKMNKEDVLTYVSWIKILFFSLS